jgi:hypothetical protein
MFYAVDGVPYSVETNLHCRVWQDEDSSTACSWDEIRDKAVPISRAAFDSLCWKVGSAARAAEAKTQREET